MPIKNKMFEVEIKKVKGKKKDQLFDFIIKKASEISFSAFHTFKINEDQIDDMIDEYKGKCKDRLHELRELYRHKSPLLLTMLKKIRIQDDDEFEQYSEEIFENEMSLIPKMKETLLNLTKKEETIDYKEAFPSISESFITYETHMFDSLSVSIIPYDYVVYKADKKVIDFVCEMDKLTSFFTSNINQKVLFFNPLFATNNEAYSIISTKDGIVSIQLSESEYEEFKKLKIKHEVEFIEDENK